MSISAAFTKYKDKEKILFTDLHEFLNSAKSRGFDTITERHIGADHWCVNWDNIETGRFDMSTKTGYIYK